MTGDTTDSNGVRDESLDSETERRRLESVEEYFEYLRESTPYYSWLDPEIHTLERGYVQLRQPNDERTKPPEVGPATGINGGILMTLGDAAGMAAIISEALEPVPLATTRVDMSFHDGDDDPHVVQAEVVDFGSTLATARLEVFPESDLGDPDRRVLASGEATARLFE
ncbi:MAG: PaaI family thioesterase [Halobacteriales archaeon]